MTCILLIVQNAIATKEAVFTAKGLDVFEGLLIEELSKDMSKGAAAIYALRVAEETAFITHVFGWLYILTVVMSLVSVCCIGLKYKKVNKIISIVLMALAVLTFIFAISVAAQWTAVETLLGKEVGFKGLIQVGIYMLIATLVQGGIQFYLNRK